MTTHGRHAPQSTAAILFIFQLTTEKHICAILAFCEWKPPMIDTEIISMSWCHHRSWDRKTKMLFTLQVRENHFQEHRASTSSLLGLRLLRNQHLVSYALISRCSPWKQGSWGHHGAHLGPAGPRWAPCWPHDPCYLGYVPVTCWRHQIETFSASLALCAGNSPVTVEFTSQRPVKRSFDVFFYLRLNKRLSKQSRRRWFEKRLKKHCWVHWSKMSKWFGSF